MCVRACVCVCICVRKKENGSFPMLKLLSPRRAAPRKPSRISFLVVPRYSLRFAVIHVCLYSIKTRNSLGAPAEREGALSFLSSLSLALFSASSRCPPFGIYAARTSESFCPREQAAKLIGSLVRHIYQCRSRFIL